MKKSILSAYAIAIAGMIGGMSGCATHNNETPLATIFPITKQQKLQAGGHWSAIANDVAERMKNNKVIDSATLSVLPPTPDTAFTKAFRNQLISALVNKGLTVTADCPPQRDCRPNAKIKGTVVEIETQLVKFAPGRYQNRRDNYKAYPEFANGETPQYELIVTTSTSKGAVFVGRSTDVYYIADLDSTLYGMLPGMTFAITGDDK